LQATVQGVVRFSAYDRLHARGVHVWITKRLDRISRAGQTVRVLFSEADGQLIKLFGKSTTSSDPISIRKTIANKKPAEAGCVLVGRTRSAK
jgi:hypothetical protein